MQTQKTIKLKFDKPIYNHCKTCFKLYNMVEWGVNCPSCKDKKEVSKKDIN